MNYTVKIKDYDQNTTHTLTFWADSKPEANSMALEYVRKNIGSQDLEII